MSCCLKRWIAGRLEWLDKKIALLYQLSINRFVVFPNPCSDDILNLGLSQNKMNEYELFIFNVNGQIVFKSDSEIEGKKVFEKSIDVSNLDKGIYFICLKSKEGTFIERFIKP